MKNIFKFYIRDLSHRLDLFNPLTSDPLKVLLGP